MVLEALFESFMDAASVGSFAAPFLIFTEPIIGIPLCILLLLNIGIQLLILWKCRVPAVKWILPMLAAVSVLACDIGIRVITGWDQLIPLFFYGTFVYNLIFTLLTILIIHLIRRRKSSEEK